MSDTVTKKADAEPAARDGSAQRRLLGISSALCERSKLARH
jgi:hypothetical protein